MLFNLQYNIGILALLNKYLIVTICNKPSEKGVKLRA